MPQCYEANVNEPQSRSHTIRRAHAGDAARIAEIFNQGLADRLATFETTPATPGAAERWIANDIVVVADRAGTSVAWAKASPYADRHHYYDGVREATLYVDRQGAADRHRPRAPCGPCRRGCRRRRAQVGWEDLHLERTQHRTNPASRS
jgi:hypothetical protein